ncbi:C40 family peptidase [Vibrio zhanjiangensis]|nr:NlpC/P60 family protein [Vibrio zhanjiangensis]
MDRRIRQALATILWLTIAGCTSHIKEDRSEPTHFDGLVSPAANELKIDFLSFYHDWEGVPYRLGGNNQYGIDCSAFVQLAYLNTVKLRLPRTTKLQVKVGQQVEYDDAQVGDLAFFKTSPSVRHVGVYLGQKRFMHASTSKGVVISRLDNPYWASTFWHFRRVYSPPELD